MSYTFYYRTPTNLFQGTLTDSMEDAGESPILLESEDPPDQQVQRGFWWPEERSAITDVRLPRGWHLVVENNNDAEPSHLRGYRDSSEILSLLGEHERARGVLLDLRSADIPKTLAHTLPVSGWIQEPSPEPYLHKPHVEAGGRDGKDPVFLLIHGFTGDPGNFHDLCQLFRVQNRAFAGPLLPGHALSPGHAREFGRESWKRSVGWWGKILSANRPVVGIGLSMGGNLVLANHGLFDACVTINTPYQIRDYRIDWLPWLKYLVPYYESPQSGKVTPVEMLIELNKLLKESRRQYGSIDTPTLVINTRDDGMVSPKDGDIMHEHLLDSERLLFSGGGHTPTEDFRVVEDLFEAITNWIKKVGATTSGP